MSRINEEFKRLDSTLTKYAEVVAHFTNMARSIEFMHTRKDPRMQLVLTTTPLAQDPRPIERFEFGVARRWITLVLSKDPNSDYGLVRVLARRKSEAKHPNDEREVADFLLTREGKADLPYVVGTAPEEDKVEADVTREDDCVALVFSCACKAYEI